MKKQALLVILLEIVLILAAIQRYGVPSGFIQIPVFIAPLVTFFISAMVFADYFRMYLFDQPYCGDACSKRVVVVCLVYTIITLVVCCVLTQFHGWAYHLGVLILLFGVFLSWDIYMLKLVSDQNHREQLRAGNHLVNRPTLIAAAIAFGLLLLQSPALAGGDSIPGSASSPSKPFHYDEKDAFVAGIVCFHLLFSACGYVITIMATTPEGGSARARRWLRLILCEVPDAPRRGTVVK